tara:strand:+ start:244 stop:810 length:567 start_codon:yes stop_codon:yes gene_type:complete
VKQILKKGENRILVGTVGAAHGLNGLVKLTSFMTEPKDIGDLHMTQDEDGNPLNFHLTGTKSGGALLACFEGVNNREEAESLRGEKLYSLRSELPAIGSEEWYYSDLIGLKANDTSGLLLGTIKDVFNFGAGDILEIKLKNDQIISIPFTRDTVPEIDLNNRSIIIVPPNSTDPVGNDKPLKILEAVE